MACIHDTRARDKRSTQSWNHDDERPPDFALGVHDVQLGSEVEGKIEQASERRAAMSGRKALEAILQDVVICLGTNRDVLEAAVGVLVINGTHDPVLVDQAARDEIWPGLANRILQGTRDREGSADTQAQSQNAAVELPQAVLEPVSPTQSFHARDARGHWRLVGEQAIDDQSVDCDYDGWSEHDVDEEPEDGDALLGGKWIVQCVVFERELLVERRDLIDYGEDSNQDDYD